MGDYIFIAAGVGSGIHVFTYGLWLKRQKNLPGFILSVLLAIAAIILPIVHKLI